MLDPHAFDARFSLFYALGKVPLLTESPDVDVEEALADDPGGPRISPRAHDRWVCKCGHEWNTFDTGGVCPACLYQWTVTACLSCDQWSAHSDWYVQD
jgi:hypothetical protein